MSRYFTTFLGRVVAAFFFFTFSSIACDGVAQTCPAEPTQALRWNAIATFGTGCDHPAYDYDSGEKAVGDAYSCMAPQFQTNFGPLYNCAEQAKQTSQYQITRVIRCTHMYNAGQWYEAFARANAGTVNTYECTKPPYLDGPDASNLCYRTVCDYVKGQTVNSWGANGPGGQSIAVTGPGTTYSPFICLPMGTSFGTKCKAASVGTATCGLKGGEGQCIYGSVKFTGGKCGEDIPPGEDADKEDKDPCYTAGDGRLVCTTASDSSGAGSNSGSNCVTNEYGQTRCVNQTPPSENCASNPTAPQCSSPEPTNCGFVNGVHHCVPSNQNCGNFNGQNVCVNPDGSLNPWDGTSQGTGGGTTGGVGTGTGTPSTGGTGTGGGNVTFEDKPDLDVNNNTGEAPSLDTPDNIEGWDDFKNNLNQPAPAEVANLFGSIPNPFSGLGGAPCCAMVMDLGPKLGSHTVSAPEWFFAGIRYLINLLLSGLALSRIVQAIKEVF